ncbi:MAG: GIY-YIG nuclease family protein [Paracoccaceae bacterium]|nr:GIY-YIG nuclease family protein [Paracoccaceae bacterium]
MWILYIIRCKDNSLYTGITLNLEKRMTSHLGGKGAKYTRGRGPFEILYTEKYPNRSEASKQEYFLKKLTSKEKLDFINEHAQKIVEK